MAETIHERDSFKAYKDDMVIYSIGINRRRSIPDDRDGFKPVQRRVVFSMYAENHAVSKGSKVKSSAIVGTVMNKYHPHGDSSIYDTMPGLGNWFECKVPMLGLFGNWGTVMGDSPAAMRYTEAWVNEFGMECIIGDLKESKSVVDWVPTYNDDNLEPEYLPSKVPVILVNGGEGMGLGMMYNVPKHNLKEVIDATLTLIRNPDAEVVLIPDHCFPCDIIDTDWREISRLGSGKYRARGHVEIGELDGHPCLFVTSLPDKVKTGNIVAKIEELVEKKQLPMIKDIIDSSGAGKIDIKIKLNKGADPYFMREVLYKKTDVEKSFVISFEVVHGINPKRVSYREYINSCIDQYIITKFRLYCGRLQDVMTRWHQLDSYIRVLESGEIDHIIDMIKKQKDTDDNIIIEYMIKKIGITDLQAKFIITSDLRKLSMGYLRKYKEEAKELVVKRELYESFIMDNEKIFKEIEDDLIHIRDKFGAPRVCKVIKGNDDSNIPKGLFKIIVTENNYIRKVMEDDKATPVRGDNPNFIIKVDNTESVLLFDNKGKVFKLPIHKIPITEKNMPGVDVRTIVKGLTANIIEVIDEPTIQNVSRLKSKHFLTVVSENNMIKKLDIEDFLNVPPSGIIYTKLVSDDVVKTVSIIPDNLDVIIYTNKKALRIAMKEVPYYKRAAQGVLAMNTTDPIKGLSVVYPNATHVVVITSMGKINKYNINGLERSVRNKAGVSVIKLDKGDSILSLYGVNDSNTLRLVTRAGATDIPVNSLAVNSSVSSGVKMVTKGDMIVRADIIL